MGTTDTAKRDAFMKGLRDLADYLSTHPGVSVPEYEARIGVACDHAEYGGSDQVTSTAEALGSGITRDQDGSVSTSRSFGPVSYVVSAVSSEAMDRYYAEKSYWGCITPDKAA
jgi:hypothetical protein